MRSGSRISTPGPRHSTCRNTPAPASKSAAAAPHWAHTPVDGVLFRPCPHLTTLQCAPLLGFCDFELDQNGPAQGRVRQLLALEADRLRAERREPLRFIGFGRAPHHALSAGPAGVHDGAEFLEA